MDEFKVGRIGILKMEKRIFSGMWIAVLQAIVLETFVENIITVLEIIEILVCFGAKQIQFRYFSAKLRQNLSSESPALLGIDAVFTTHHRI